MRMARLVVPVAHAVVAPAAHAVVAPVGAMTSEADEQENLVWDFDLELLGGSIERRYRKMRPEVEAMPWPAFDPASLPPHQRESARTAWTHAAFQEFRTGAACSMALTSLIEAKAPLDLIALAARFPLDEVVHVELCARMAMLLGGAAHIQYTPDEMIHKPPADWSPQGRAAHIVVRLFCVGEAVSIPLLRRIWHAAEHPLPKAILSRIVRDEAAHGTFGFAFLDWVIPQLPTSEFEQLATTADRAMRQVYETWSSLAAFETEQDLRFNPLGWMKSREFADLARRSMLSHVVAPLHERRILVEEHTRAGGCGSV